MASENFISNVLTRAKLLRLQEHFEEQGIDKTALLHLINSASGSLEERFFNELIPRIGDRIRILEAVSFYQNTNSDDNENTDYEISEENNAEKLLLNIKIDDIGKKEFALGDEIMTKQISDIVTIFNKATDKMTTPVSGGENKNVYDPSEQKYESQDKRNVFDGKKQKTNNGDADSERAENKLPQTGPSRKMYDSKLDQKRTNKDNKNKTNNMTDEERQKPNAKWKKAAIIGGTAAVAGVAAAAAAPIVLAGAGFTATGIAAGSIAAGFQSIIGSVAAGSLFASLTGAGMAGMAATTTAAVGATVGGVAAVGAAAAVVGSDSANNSASQTSGNRNAKTEIENSGHTDTSFIKTKEPETEENCQFEQFKLNLN